MDLKQIGIKYGLYAGLGTVISYQLALTFGRETYFSGWVTALTWVIYLVAMTIGSREARLVWINEYSESNEPYTFTQALQVPFIVFLIAQVTYYTHYWLVFNVFDPALVDTARTVALEAIERSSEFMGSMLDEDTIDNMLQRAENQDYSVTLKNAFFSFASSLIFGFLISCIYALIYRKERNQNA
jgi:hypothetical protein